MADKTPFISYVLAGYPCLYVNTHEEWRVLTRYVSDLTTKPKNPYKCYTWDCVDGIVPVGIEDNVLASGKKVTIEGTPVVDPVVALQWIEGMDGPDGHIGAEEYSAVFLKDFHEYLRSESNIRAPLCRKIRNIIPKLKATGKVLVILSPTITLPTEVEKDVKVIKFGLPDRTELKAVLKSVSEAGDVKYPQQDDELIDAALGMSSLEAENAYAISLVEKKKFDPEIIRTEKAAIVEKTGLLEVIETHETLDDVGGLENLKGWLIERQDNFTHDAKEFGVDAPKGSLLVGVPGGGKSLVAKVFGTAWRRPVLRMDVGRLFNSLQGETEANVRKATAIAEAIAPCVLWIDELEKSFSGTKGSDSDGHGTTKRVFQAFLTWMQEKTADVFIVATANDVQSLPPELMRAGRLDVTFWVDIPDVVQRREILGIHLRKKGRDPEKMFADTSSTKTLLNQMNGFTGAEIEQVVKNAVTIAFSHKHSDIEYDDMIAAIGSVTPVSRLRRDEIQAARQWAEERGALQASIEHKEETVAAAGSGKRRFNK